MVAVLYLLLYLVCGCVIVRMLLPRHPVLNRLWLGTSLGLLLMMWLPALAAFVIGFTLPAHGAAAGLLLGLTALCYAARDRQHPVMGWSASETRMLKQLLVVVPLALISGYLQYTHNFRYDPLTGAYHVGQSTYGDLPMHTSFVTGLVNSTFPPEYPFYPGHRLSYPFLTDTMSTSLYMMGFSLQAALAVPGTLMMVLCYTGVMLLGRELTAGKKTIVLAALLFFLNGGLGFLYDFDLAGGFESNGTLTAWQRVLNILEGYYKTPTNQPDPNNLRWSNIICDMLVPQRTFLGGLCMVLPCFYLLFTCFRQDKRADEEDGWRGVMLLGIWSGLLPLVHTHSFAALAMYSAGIMLYDLIHRSDAIKVLRRYLVYAALAALVALPQLFAFTFTQTFQEAGMEGAGNTFIRFQFNWVNNPNGTGMRDMYFWFYIKNMGIPFVAVLLALFEKDHRWRRLACGSFVIMLAAELIRFQPNEYDNNKLIYIAYLFACMIAADWLAMMWRRMKGLRARPLMAAVTTVVLFLSAGLTIWRECVSDYWAFNGSEVEAGEFVRDHTPQQAVFITGTQHLNPVDSIGGRRIVCGPDLWLYFHGFDTGIRKYDISRFFSHPAENLDVLDKYDVDYIYVSSYEQMDYQADWDYFEEHYDLIFDNGAAAIFAVGEG